MPKPNVTIAELRMRENKMSQKQLAKAIGVSTQTINAWEKDITIIKGENLIKLCRYFNVKASDILGAFFRAQDNLKLAQDTVGNSRIQ